VTLTAALANSLWSASNLPAYARFRRALHRPLETQMERLQVLLRRNASTAFGRAHGFERIRTYGDFARRVPMADYDAFAPWVDRIRKGEQEVLTADKVTHLIPTSGSMGARKLIPFTPGLQREFHAAIAPWLVDLQSNFPGVIAGPAYWSITPPVGGALADPSAVPIGFESDSAYLGGARAALARATFALSPEALWSGAGNSFQYNTLLHLLRCCDLRLISIWHPSFLTLLLDALPGYWERLLADIAAGRNLSGCAVLKPLPRRAKEVESFGPHHPSELWPRLAVISCWADGPAALPARELADRFLNARIQPKGLLATEGVITAPFGSMHPLAVASSFYEFLDDDGRALTCDRLQTGAEYEAVITTGGGLYRYRQGDRVRVDGWNGRTPSLQFLGRAGCVSDLFGEKLSEAFVTQALNEVFGEQAPRFALLAPEPEQHCARYVLYVEGPAEAGWAETLEATLHRNPQYACCRNLGQLLPLRVVSVRDGYGSFVKRLGAGGSRVGDIKPASLSKLSGWVEHFHLATSSKPERQDLTRARHTAPPRVGLKPNASVS
jgi:hypothetical protein